MNTPASLDTTDEIAEVEATIKEHLFETDRASEHVTKDPAEIKRLKDERRDLSEDASESVERRKASVESPQMPSLAQLEELHKTLKESLKTQEELLKNQKENSKSQEELNEKQLRYTEGGFRYARLGFWAALFIAIVTPIIPFLLTRILTNQQETRAEIKETRADMKETQKARLIVITSPGDNGIVKLNSTVSGKTPFLGMKHYVVVTPIENRVNWVSNPVSVDADGSFTGEVQFGEGDNGIGKKFIIRILVTNSFLATGALSSLPEDAIISDAITVTRQN